MAAEVFTQKISQLINFFKVDETANSARKHIFNNIVATGTVWYYKVGRTEPVVYEDLKKHSESKNRKRGEEQINSLYRKIRKVEQTTIIALLKDLFGENAMEEFLGVFDKQMELMGFQIAMMLYPIKNWVTLHKPIR